MPRIAKGRLDHTSGFQKPMISMFKEIKNRLNEDAIVLMTTERTIISIQNMFG